MGRTYLDFNATTPMPEPVRHALAEAAVRLAGNPSSPHREGQEARQVLDEAREEVARLAGVRPGEVIFTSGGTESNNLALRGLAAAAARTARRPPRILVSAVEHPSVLETARDLARDGASVEILPVDRDGRVEPAVLEEALAQGADVVSVMHANNETGVIQPIEDLAAAAFEAGAAFHTDMCQALGKIPVDGAAARATACSLAAHKIGGPPGIGALLLRQGAAFASPMTGGAQEGRRRA
ncbi:MAG TPA: aminotransferase class V-fold PLP-dependent enzyme, partial [Candidatus Saccharimonadales bacterium]|nr:aminotransferase class V-fold PLP-dependent enzyme [Candidatus Saccharimonadales bacterium]